jgi:outer membrane protein with beta-barrel domain
MNRVVRLLAVAVICLAAGRAADAQEPPPPISRFVVDLHGVVPKFGDDPQLAASRGLTSDELPGPGIGFTVGGHVYFARIAAVTLGVGAELAVGRAHAASVTSADQTSSRGPVTETFTSIAPAVSLNFGNGNGWSYLAVGIGQSVWSIVPDGAQPLPIDQERQRTINYGGGARWFIRKRLAFSLDVRLYEIAASTPQAGMIGAPRTRLLVIGAGISVR